MTFEVLDYYKIKYNVYIKKIKRLSLSYNKYNELDIKVPLYLEKDTVDRFINDHIDWILKNEPSRPLPHETYSEGSSYLLLGKTYKLHIIYQHHEEVIKEDNTIIIYTKKDENIKGLLNKFRLNIAEIVFNEILYKSFTSMSKYLSTYPSLTIKKSKAKWGCCYIKENRIMLNISLVHVPLALIEYVIYHELTHLIYPNHQKEFHDFLGMFVPNEKLLRKELKNYNCMYE